MGALATPAQNFPLQWHMPIDGDVAEAALQRSTTGAVAGAYLGYDLAGSIKRQRPNEFLGFANGGPVRLNQGGLPGEPWDPWVSFEQQYGTGEPGNAWIWAHGVMSGQDPMWNAQGGHIRGPGTATSDSIPALLSDGEFVMRAAAVKHWGVNRLNAMNALHGYAPGGPVIDPNLNPPIADDIANTNLINSDGGTQSITDPGLTAPPAPAQAPAPAQSPMSGNPVPPPPNDLSQIPYLGKEASQAATGILGSILAPKAASSGGSPGAPQPRSIDPRATLAPAPTSSQHIHPALAATISAPIGLIGSAVGQAASAAASVGTAAALAGATMGGGAALAPFAAPMAGQMAGQMAQFGTQMANDVAVGAANILSSLFVGTVTPSKTGQGYGAPLLPQTPQPVTNFQSIHNGNVVTNNLTEYNRLRDRKDAQKAAPFFNRVGT